MIAIATIIISHIVAKSFATISMLLPSFRYIIDILYMDMGSSLSTAVYDICTSPVPTHKGIISHKFIPFFSSWFQSLIQICAFQEHPLLIGLSHFDIWLSLSAFFFSNFHFLPPTLPSAVHTTLLSSSTATVTT